MILSLTKNLDRYSARIVCGPRRKTLDKIPVRDEAWRRKYDGPAYTTENNIETEIDIEAPTLDKLIEKIAYLYKPFYDKADIEDILKIQYPDIV